MEDTLKEVEKILYDVERVLFNNSVFKKRAVGLGYINPSWVDEYGITGPNARGTGLPRDVRKDNPYLKYPKLEFRPITETDSDVYARTRLRWRDTLLSIDLIRQILAGTPETGEFKTKLPSMLHWKIRAGETHVKAECTRGEYGYYVVTDEVPVIPGGVNVRGPSYTHAMTLAEKIAGQL